MTTGLDYWFTIYFERSLQDSLDVGKAYYQASQKGTLIYAQQISQDLGQQGPLGTGDPEFLQRLIQDKRQEYGLALVQVYLPTLEQRFQVNTPEPFLKYFQQPALASIEKGFRPSGFTEIQSTREGDFFLAGVPIWDQSVPRRPQAALLVVSYFPKSLMAKMDTISAGLEGYRQMQLLRNPIKLVYLVILSIVTLLIVFSATWFGFYLAKGITIPIQRLAEGTYRVAQGDYNFSIDLDAKDEFGLLVQSFNRMTADLKQSQTELERINEELRKSYEEINHRRRYMETILANIGAGVISVDAQGKITIINTSAKEMLLIKTEKVLGRPYREVLGPEHLAIVQDFIPSLDLLKKGTIERSLKVSLRDRTLTLLIKITVLRDEEGRSLGMVLVFDDLTEIEKMQKVSAWREVARRLAHEIKNPLTPIKLSAQRLRKKYLDQLPAGREVFDECTQTIINQVDELTRLVNEFFAFARLPAVNLSVNDLNSLIQEVMVLYQGSHRRIHFSFDPDSGLPPFPLDREQIKRVMINLLDNAVAAVTDEGAIAVQTRYNPVLQMAQIEVHDTGIGISSQDKNRLFEPYFSTKKGGTGLGLTIVSSIISDHRGHIRVKNNTPKGTVFMIELPLGA